MSRILKNKNILITQSYKASHGGIDMVGEGHTLDYIIAHSDGTVKQVQTGKVNAKGSKGLESYGNFVKIEHENGFSTLYAHLEYVDGSIYDGKYVNKGEVLGYMGESGNAYGRHLHFEVRKNNVRIDPTPYIDKDFTENTQNTSNLEDVARDVIRGVYGNGEERKQKLENAGYNYSEVQAIVNKMLNGSSNSVNLEDVAKDVIKGVYGNGEERRQKLEKAGYNYSEVQAIVNRMLR